VAALADAGRDIVQVASQAEGEARRRLLASASDPVAARRLAVVLRGVAEAAGAGARDGRARLLLELLAVEPASTESAAVAVPVRPAAAARPDPAPAPAERPAPEPPASASVPKAAASPARGNGATAADAGRTEPPEASAPAEPPRPVATPVGAVPGDVAELRARWAEVVERATPVIKPLLRECRPIGRDGARLTLAFPEGRDFMRSRISQRSGSIETLLSEMFGGPFAIECVATNLELEPLTVEQAVGDPDEDPEARALLEGVLKITGGELVDVREVR
jgi:hypothetical protein